MVEPSAARTGESQCLGCGVVSEMALGEVFLAAELGTFSLAGMQDKVSARKYPTASCDHCGWRVAILGQKPSGSLAVTVLDEGSGPSEQTLGP